MPKADDDFPCHDLVAGNLDLRHFFGVASIESGLGGDILVRDGILFRHV
jgi:hypothetical protein